MTPTGASVRSTTTAPPPPTVAAVLAMAAEPGLQASRRLLGVAKPWWSEIPAVGSDLPPLTSVLVDALARHFEHEPASWVMRPLGQPCYLENNEDLTWASLTATYTTHFADFLLTMSKPQGYTWQERLQELRDWRGDEGEAERLSESALNTAADMASYAAQRLAARGVRVTTVLSGLGSGGVQVEWTVRTSTPHYHLEIEIPRDEQEPIVLLRTRDAPDGEILRAREVRNASMAEAMAEIEKLARHAERAAMTAQQGTLASTRR